ncbi:hypothetical protein L207DRAFT_631930 [Hyaloscypha variabilis F]|uniref:Uncharacterized protein n=1 Tax=Hyaloscypha variabilis (strain UAMH 11265 / GT02V1 / F) TaxID=1149755 RepID=A0A2J6RU75_HYAVF|nr:hypothetical protein L207DRAFT_631930 [Hyaloscypha variabilis F]
MVSTPPRAFSQSRRKHTRRPFSPKRRTEVALTRRLGACTDCRRRKVGCSHAREKSSGLQSIAISANSHVSSLHRLNNFASSLPLESAPDNRSKAEIQYNNLDKTGLLDSELRGNHSTTLSGIETKLAQALLTSGYGMGMDVTTAGSSELGTESPLQGMQIAPAPLHPNRLGGSTSPMHHNMQKSFAMQVAGNMTALDHVYLSQPPSPDTGASEPGADDVLASIAAPSRTINEYWLEGNPSNHPTTLTSMVSFNQVQEAFLGQAEVDLEMDFSTMNNMLEAVGPQDDQELTLGTLDFGSQEISSHSTETNVCNNTMIMLKYD